MSELPQRIGHCLSLQKTVMVISSVELLMYKQLLLDVSSTSSKYLDSHLWRRFKPWLCIEKKHFYSKKKICFLFHILYFSLYVLVYFSVFWCSGFNFLHLLKTTRHSWGLLKTTCHQHPSTKSKKTGHCIFLSPWKVLKTNQKGWYWNRKLTFEAPGHVI